MCDASSAHPRQFPQVIECLVEVRRRGGRQTPVAVALREQEQFVIVIKLIVKQLHEQFI